MGNMAEKLSLKELCKELSISPATGKNWVRLGKIVPETTSDNELYFDKTFVEELKRNIKNGKIVALKSRRNKKYVSGNKLYSSYVSDESVNTDTVRKLIDYIDENRIKLTENKIAEIVSCCAFSLIKNSVAEENIKEYLPLIEDISKKYKESEFNKFIFTPEKNEDILGLIYISLKNIGDRKSKGSYYTPTTVVKKLCSNLKLKRGQSVYDCCCGTGNFLLQIDADFNDIFGNDIDKMSVKIARLNMAIKYGVTDEALLNLHITNNDFLTFEDKKKYDFIIGNPPWGADIKDKKYKESYDAMTDEALGLLKQNGVLSFVLPEAILNVKSHNKIRKVISENNSVKYIEYLGDIFDGVQCPSVILQILHNDKPFDTKGMRVVTKDRDFVIDENREIDSEYFNFLSDNEEYKIIKKIENISNKITLKNRSKFALGIVTGDNKKYLSDKKNNKNEIILKGVNIHKYNYENSDTYITFTPEKFQQVAPVEFYKAKEKLFYKFISSELVFAYDNKQTLSLNSCNILIPQVAGLDIKYIMAVLNSRVAQFYFRGKYNSIKVLRSHIESIPIPFPDENIQQEIIGLVNDMLNQPLKDKYNQIDRRISGLYGLNYREYSLICSVQ